MARTRVGAIKRRDYGWDAETEEEQLALWVEEQTIAYLKGELSPERVRRLEKVPNWKWELADTFLERSKRRKALSTNVKKAFDCITKEKPKTTRMSKKEAMQCLLDEMTHHLQQNAQYSFKGRTRNCISFLYGPDPDREPGLFEVRMSFDICPEGEKEVR